MFHFGLPSEKLDFQDENHFINRYQKVLYVGSGFDVMPLPIARRAVYVETGDINMELFVKEVKKMFTILDNPTIEWSAIEDRPIAIMILKWAEMPNLTRYVDERLAAELSKIYFSISDLVTLHI